MTRILAITASALLATGAYAASHTMMIDADANGSLTMEEYEAAASMLDMTFEGVDADGDGMISEIEYNEAAFDAADEDDSNSLDPEESAKFRDLTRAF